MSALRAHIFSKMQVVLPFPAVPSTESKFDIGVIDVVRSISDKLYRAVRDRYTIAGGVPLAMVLEAIHGNPAMDSVGGVYDIRQRISHSPVFAHNPSGVDVFTSASMEDIQALFPGMVVTNDTGRDRGTVVFESVQVTVTCVHPRFGSQVMVACEMEFDMGMCCCYYDWRGLHVGVRAIDAIMTGKYLVHQNTELRLSRMYTFAQRGWTGEYFFNQENRSRGFRSSDRVTPDNVRVVEHLRDQRIRLHTLIFSRFMCTFDELSRYFHCAENLVFEHCTMRGMAKFIYDGLPVDRHPESITYRDCHLTDFVMPMGSPETSIHDSTIVGGYIGSCTKLSNCNVSRVVVWIAAHSDYENEYRMEKITGRMSLISPVDYSIRFIDSDVIIDIDRKSKVSIDASSSRIHVKYIGREAGSSITFFARYSTISVFKWSDDIKIRLFEHSTIITDVATDADIQPLSYTEIYDALRGSASAYGSPLSQRIENLIEMVAVKLREPELRPSVWDMLPVAVPPLALGAVGESARPRWADPTPAEQAAWAAATAAAAVRDSRRASPVLRRSARRDSPRDSSPRRAAAGFAAGVAAMSHNASTRTTPSRVEPLARTGSEVMF